MLVRHQGNSRQMDSIEHYKIMALDDNDVFAIGRPGEVGTKGLCP